MISVTEADWNTFCDSILQEPARTREAIKWITAQRVDVDGSYECPHDRTREISIADGGKKVFCVNCAQQV